MIGIEEDHSGASPRRAASHSASRVRRHSSSTSRMNSLSWNMPTTLAGKFLTNSDACCLLSSAPTGRGSIARGVSPWDSGIAVG